MLFATTRGTTYTVAPCASTEQQDDISRSRGLTTHSVSTHCPHHSTYLQAFCHIGGVVNLTHMGGSQTYLITIGRVAGRRLAGDNLLWQFARHGL